MILKDQVNRIFEYEASGFGYCGIKQLLAQQPQDRVEILSILYDLLPKDRRYLAYQRQFHNFNIQSGDKVLDMGSGHDPFELATHLADIIIDGGIDETAEFGRLHEFKHVDGKPVITCDVENTPFEDKEFDFVYCSHMIEHVKNPEKACAELMRIGKRGYIEAPAPFKELMLNQIVVSNHRWAVENRRGKLVFTEYSPGDIAKSFPPIVTDIIYDPQTDREKAFTSLIWLNGDVFNTMLLWEYCFECEVRRL
ncbi:MAG TPA: class I SAM-dependent methyltransferase [bacterium]|nr:class I SAM-dependent methyltransferase [bacterium]